MLIIMPLISMLHGCHKFRPLFIFHSLISKTMPKYTNCWNWKCGRCKLENRGRIVDKCIKCGDSKSNGQSLDRLPGDWVCFHCKTNNFAKRSTCYKCSRPKKQWFLCSSNVLQEYKFGHISCSVLFLSFVY